MSKKTCNDKFCDAFTVDADGNVCANVVIKSTAAEDCKCEVSFNEDTCELSLSSGSKVTLPFNKENCFYVDGDCTESNAANKIKDALDNGKALAITDGNGTAIAVYNPVGLSDLLGYVTNLGGTLDTNTWKFTGVENIAICCEEETCGYINPAWVTHNANNDSNSPAEQVHYRAGRAHEIPVSMTTFTGTPVGYSFGRAWCSQDRVVVAGPPRITSQEPGTVSSDTDCCPLTCEPVCEEWRILLTDLDRNAILTVINPGDINLASGSGGGIWTEVTACVWEYDINGDTNSNGIFSIFADCDKQIQFSIDLLSGDCVGLQTRIREGRAVLVKYVCDPSVPGNIISATLPNGNTVNPSSVVIP